MPVHANCTNESRGRYSFLPAVAIDNRPSTDSTAENTLKTNANNKKHFPFYIPDASIFINGSRSVRLSSFPIFTSTKQVKDGISALALLQLGMPSYVSQNLSRIIVQSASKRKTHPPPPTSTPLPPGESVYVYIKTARSAAPPNIHR